jgi:uncharacterized protein YihD (DUF1040 family)
MISIGLKDYWKNNKKNSLKWKLKNLRWELRYAWRRAWYGYDDIDVIEIGCSFIERYKVILKDFRKHHHGLFNVPEEYRDIFNKYFFNEEETDAIIDIMIYHLEMMDEDCVEKVLYGMNIYDDDYEIAENMYERYKRISSVMNQNKEAFMKLFNLFFWDLWD